jgi:transcriptional regulator with XRE-family HTH domain
MDSGWAELGTVIRRHRRAAGLSQEGLAERAGSHFTYISEIETNRVNPSINVLRRLAEALGVELSELIREAEVLQRARRD